MLIADRRLAGSYKICGLTMIVINYFTVRYFFQYDEYVDHVYGLLQINIKELMRKININD